MTDIGESVGVAVRVVARWKDGARAMRVWNAAEEPHIMAALDAGLDAMATAIALADENAALREELAEHRKRAAESITI